MRRIVLAAALAAASLSFGLSPASATVTNPPDAGASLGVDIAGLPLDAADVHNFLSSLDPQTRAGVEGACVTYQRFPDEADSVQTLCFCDEIHAAA